MTTIVVHVVIATNKTNAMEGAKTQGVSATEVKETKAVEAAPAKKVVKEEAGE